MNDLGCHCIAAARYFFGKQDRIEKVMAWGARLVHHEKTAGEDNALLLLQFSSGGLGHCELSWTTKGGLDLRNEVHGYHAEMRHFVECVRDGVTPRETYEDGYLVNRILDAGYASMRSGQWVPVEYS